MKKLISILLILTMLLSFTSCGTDEPEAENALDLSTAEWEQIVEAAKGTTVTYYGWGGDEIRNTWLNSTLADYLKSNYDITLEVVGMNIDEILTKLSGEKQAGSGNGSIDMIWINGENFYSAKANGLLYGPFTNKLPNMEKYIDLEDPETLSDFCMPIEGYEAPYARAQMVTLYDSAKVTDVPANAQEFLEFCKANPGKVTYPALPDFTGSAFVRNLIYEVCGWEQFQTMEADKETVKAAIQPAIDYLKELNPYLWNEGKTFPDSSTTVDQMFADGELLLHMTYGPFAAATGIADGSYADTVKTFVFENGTIGNTSYTAIAFNSPNKAGAMVVINAMLSSELQLNFYEETKGLPVVDNSKLTEEELAAFNAVTIGEGVLTQEQLLTHRLPEMPAALVPVIEEIWLEEVVGK